MGTEKRTDPGRHTTEAQHRELAEMVARLSEEMWKVAKHAYGITSDASLCPGCRSDMARVEGFLEITGSTLGMIAMRLMEKADVLGASKPEDELEAVKSMIHKES